MALSQISKLALVALLTVSAPAAAQSTKWKLQDDFFATTPAAFFQGFSFFTQQDPTDGSITYVDAATAEKDGLIGFLPPARNGTSAPSSQFSVYMGIDRTAANAPQRNSVRITSTAKYNAPLLLAVDVAHMPVGPSTWPAFWLLGADGTWPASGELDVIEGVNAFAGGPPVANAMTLHAGPGCRVAANASGAAYAGTLVTADCDVNDPAQPKNAGCSIAAPPGLASFGPAFNAAGGGTYVAAWEAAGFTVWFFPAAGAAAARPKSLDSAAPDTSEFGTPVAVFGGGGCDWTRSFRDMQIIFNTALCGQWAGQASVWESSGCQQYTGDATCQQYVTDATGLGDAYWLVDGLRVFGQ